MKSPFFALVVLIFATSAEGAGERCPEVYARGATAQVALVDRAEKSLRKLPKQVQSKFEAWKHDLEAQGLQEVRKIPGYHDEPLQGRLQGVHSVRLGQGYRLFYRSTESDNIVVEEVNKHDYKEIERILGY